MATKYAINSAAKITIKNIYDEGNVSSGTELALGLLDEAKGLWNRGLNAVAGGDAVVSAGEFFTKGIEHNAAIKLYNNNSYVILAPGDTFEITAKSNNEAAYYAGLKSPLIEVTCDPAFATEDSTDPAAVNEENGDTPAADEGAGDDANADAGEDEAAE